MRWTEVVPIVIAIAVGIGLRAQLTATLPPSYAYDNHLEHVEKVLRTGRLPRPDECWQCYQPPLFYGLAAGTWAVTERVSQSAGATPERAAALGRKACQWLNCVIGSLTLVVVALTLRQAVPQAPGWAQGLGVGLIAVLPQHIYMSSMVTNDVLVYLVASLALYAALRTDAGGWRWPGALVTGMLAGASVLAKAYGLVTLAAILAFAVVRLVQRRFFGDAERSASPKAGLAATRGGRSPWLGFAVLLIGAALMGAWPGLRNLALYGRTHVDNFDFFRTGMLSMPPGSVDRVEFLTFRPIALMQRPFVHLSHVNSFWTEFYARLWFDYEGIQIALKGAAEWQRHVQKHVRAGWTREAWMRILSWTDGDVPAAFLPVGRVSYAAGLVATLAVVAGLAAALRRCWSQPALLLIALHFAACVAVPITQTLRLPHFAAMKATFALSAVSSAAVFVVLALLWLPRRWRWAGGGALAVSYLLVAGSGAAFAMLVARQVERGAG